MRVWLLFLLLSTGCAKHLEPSMVPASTVEYRTEDGWTGQIRRYPGDGPPVLLVHGMGANHYNWDFREEVSLAWHLQQQGWDVWVPELRGDPGATPPDRRAAKTFTFDDHAEKDLPVIVDAVLAETGEAKLYWVGHSMGGMLLYTALATYPEKIEAGVAISSPSTLETQYGSHKALRGMGWAMGGRGKIPARAFATLTRPLGRANPLYGRLANRENLDWPIANGLARVALVDLPRPMAKQAVRWLKAREFTTVEGEPWMKPADVPLLVMGGEADKVVPEPNVAHTCSIFADCTYVRMAAEEGFSADYGHVDPVVGKQAATEIYPIVSGFLNEHRAAAAARAD